MAKNGVADKAPPAKAADAVLKASVPIPVDAKEVSGIEFNNNQNRDMTVTEMISAMAGMGFQATAVSEAARIINEMVRESDYICRGLAKLIAADCKAISQPIPGAASSDDHLPRVHI